MTADEFRDALATAIEPNDQWKQLDNGAVDAHTRDGDPYLVVQTEEGRFQVIVRRVDK